ncbi:MAG TPA: 30S ribosomal protein S1 [Flavobacteriales bacterium]|nr:30S ribosomal protein S1 [Flavobacteriales bacterium]
MSEETQQPEEQQENDAPQVEKNTPPNEQVEPVNDGDLEIPHEAQASNPESLTERPALAEPGEFDWNAFEADVDDYSAEDRASLEVTYENSLNLIQEKEVVDGTVVAITKKEVVVNIGYKSEGIVNASEFRYNPDLKEGDVVPIFVERQEDKNGQLVVSHRTARIFSAWDKINEAKEKDAIIQGDVKCRTKGGLIVDVFGIEAFLPGSQVDVKPIRDFDVYVGKQMDFKVVKINQEFKNVVVSHKALIEAELEEQKRVIISGLEKGQVLEGTVKNITSYGVFVDLGGIDGLVHITDMSWGRVNHPEELVELDQQLNVVILDFDDDKKRIALGMKQLTSHPWDSMTGDLAEGGRIKGKVVVIADYGAFVEIAPGVEGLLHVSEMSWSQHLRSAQDFLSVGDDIECIILNIDREDRKMSLGLKQLKQDPWAEIDQRYPLNSKQKGIVRNFTNFGLFVELEEGIDGLVHISDLSWSKKVKHPSEFCSINDEIEVMVLELDKENRRMSLGHKQLEENPWEVFETIFAVGSKHSGTVVKMDGNQAVVALPYGLEGSCHIKHLRKKDESNVDVEETADFVVLEFNRNAKRITVSHMRTFEDAPASASSTKERKPRSGAGNNRMMNEVNSSVERSTFGDLDVLSALKEQMNDGDSVEATEEPKKKEKSAKKASVKKTTTDKVDDVNEIKAAEEEVVEEVKKPAKKKAPAKKAPAKKATAKKAPSKKTKKADSAVASEAKKKAKK